MTDRERIITLRRAGFPNRTIAAMIGVDTDDVNATLHDGDPLPGGGGGSGLDIGPWTLIEGDTVPDLAVPFEVYAKVFANAADGMAQLINDSDGGSTADNANGGDGAGLFVRSMFPPHSEVRLDMTNAALGFGGGFYYRTLA